MNPNKQTLLVIATLITISLASCTERTTLTGSVNPPGQILKGTVDAINTQTSNALQVTRDQPGLTTPEPPLTEDQSSGPEIFSQGINPLTGLSVADSDLLNLPPALVSITNFPPSTRKIQGGLDFAAQVYEVYIGEGMTRFLAVFYGSFPDPDELPLNQNTTVERLIGVGPIRSGRTVYESIRARLNGFLVMASADKNTRSQLSRVVNIFGSDSDDINSSMIDVRQLMDIAESYKKPVSVKMLSGNAYNTLIPADGIPATRLWIYYNALDQVLWEYQPGLGGYYRYQDNADESGEYTLVVDALNGHPLLYENVIILFAEHEFLKPTLINIKLDYIFQGKALLFRDGLMNKIYWTSRTGEFEQTTGLIRPIRYTNYYNEAFPLKPGQSWVHLVDVNHHFWEADPLRPFESLADSAFWAVRFYDQSQNPD